MKKLKKKYLIFDLDGVLIDSKSNMKKSWNKVQVMYGIENIKFQNYFDNIGRPFFDILKIIGVKNNHKKIFKTYQKESEKNNHYIRYYKDAVRVLKRMKKNKFILNILTSKDLKRTKLVLGKNIKYFKFIECGSNKVRGKPNPYLLNKIIGKLKANKKDCVYIGDTNIDYQTAKNSKIDFIFAKWGYGKKFNYKHKPKKISDLCKILVKN